MKGFDLLLMLGIWSVAILGCSKPEKKPEWQKARILADKLDHPSALTSDGEFIYYVTGGTIASLNEGTSGVWKMPLAGGPPVELVKGRRIDEKTVLLPDTFILETDEKYVYWAAGAIYRTPKTGGEAQQIAPGKPTEFAHDETRIYWHNYGGENSPPTPIYSADKKGGGEARPLTEPVITSGILLDRDFLYWVQGDGIYKIPKTGGEKSKIYTPPANESLSGLQADENSFYFTQGRGRNALFKIPRTGGDAVRIAPEINSVEGFRVDGKTVYFFKNVGSFDTSLNKIASDGGEVVLIDEGHSRSFTIGRSKIFVTDISRIYALEK